MRRSTATTDTPMKSRLAASASAAFTLLAAACYTQKPLDVAVPAPDTRIVAIVTDSGAVALSNTIGPGAMEVEGVVTEADQSQWKVQLLRVDNRFGVSNKWQGQPVIFPSSSLTRTRVKRLDNTRSWLAATGIVAGAFIAAKAFGSAFAGDDPGGGGGPPPQN